MTVHPIWKGRIANFVFVSTLYSCVRGSVKSRFSMTLAPHGAALNMAVDEALLAVIAGAGAEGYRWAAAGGFIWLFREMGAGPRRVPGS